MDESGRMRMGISAGAGESRRRTSEKKPPELEPEDFDDVFGGPPKSVLARKLSADFTNAEWFYLEIFRQQESPAPANFAGRRLPEFVIPERPPRLRAWAKCKGKCMSRSRSRSMSWSAQSFDELGLAGELSPYSPAVRSHREDHEDVALSSFTSKLRPINVPNRWSSLYSTRKHKKQELPPFGCTQTAHMNENACNNYMMESFNPRFSPRVASYETTNMGPTSLGIPGMDDYDMQQLESPSSAISAISLAKTTSFSRDEVIGMDSWAPEVNNNAEEIDICEAIAWAKEKFQGWSLDHEASLGG